MVYYSPLVHLMRGWTLSVPERDEARKLELSLALAIYLEEWAAAYVPCGIGKQFWVVKQVMAASCGLIGVSLGEASIVIFCFFFFLVVGPSYEFLRLLKVVVLSFVSRTGSVSSGPILRSMTSTLLLSFRTGLMLMSSFNALSLRNWGSWCYY